MDYNTNYTNDKNVINDTFALEILHDYKRGNIIRDIIIFVLLGIIVLFVGGLVYFLVNYDFEFTDESTTLDGNGVNYYNKDVKGNVDNGN